jgi:gamma-glutamyltranspeptidase/glutathione hydrolase
MLIFEPGAGPTDAGQVLALDYRETCPAAVGPEFYAALADPSASRFGWKASGVPGSVAGLCFALEKFGRLELKTVLQPAIRAAEDGFAADEAFVKAMQTAGKEIAARPELRQAMGVMWSDLCREGKVAIGDLIRNPDQAKALRLIAEHGPKAFYEGAIGQAITDAMHAHAGTLTAADLAGYRVREMQPLRGEFQGYEILSMPPPSSGGIAILQTLGILSYRSPDFKHTKHNTANYVHLVAEAMKHAFANRAVHLADPDFKQVPEWLLWTATIRTMAQEINLSRTRDPQQYGLQGMSPATLPDDGGTSHFSVIDSQGMAVSCTETINLEFGSLVCVPGFGFCLNNEMDDFTTQPGKSNAFGLKQSDANLPRPGQRPLSSMSPTIVLHDGTVAMIAGGSGGPRIISATTQCLLNATMFGMTPEQAVGAPRFHHQWMPDTLLFDTRWTNVMVVEEMRKRGHATGTLTNESAVQMIAIDAMGNIRAASDPRKGGQPAGY